MTFNIIIILSTINKEIARIVNLPLTGNYMGTVVGQILGEIAEDKVNHS